MNVKFKGSYRSAKGNTVFRYAVSGTPAQLESYKKAQGDNYREDDSTGEPLWFTTRFIGNNGKLVLTSKGTIVPDMSAYEQADSLAKQYGGNFGQELAKMAAAQLLGSSNNASVVAPAAVTTEKPIGSM